MKNKHLSDENLQAFALHELMDATIALHIIECTACNAKFETYQNLFRTIHTLEPETFSFDVSVLVMQKINVTETKKASFVNYVLIMFLVLAIIVIAAASFPLLIPVLKAFRAINNTPTIFIFSSAFGIFFYLFMDVIRQYKQKEKLLLH